MTAVVISAVHRVSGASQHMQFMTKSVVSKKTAGAGEKTGRIHTARRIIKVKIRHIVRDKASKAY